MANPEKGEAEVIVNGKPYTLKMSINAAAICQHRHKKTGGALLREAEDLDFVSIRALVWVLLQKFHAKEFPTEERVGEFMDEAGGLNFFLKAIQLLAEINSAGPDPNLTAQGTNGTGESSTSMLAASASPLSSSGTAPH
jgi:hypothetical protein